MNILQIPFPIWQLNQSYEVVSLNPLASSITENPSTDPQLKRLLESTESGNYLYKIQYKWFNCNVWKDSQFI